MENMVVNRLDNESRTRKPNRVSSCRFWLNELIFIGPILLCFVIIKIIPLATTVIYSLTSWNGISAAMDYSGLSNYKLLFSDTQYWYSLAFTLRFAFISVLLSNVLGFLLAYALTRPLHFRNVMRAGFYIPNTIGGLVLGFIWRFIFITVFTYLYQITNWKIFGLAWLSTSGTSFWGMVWVQVWVLSGYLMLLYIAGLSVVPADCLESARIDGASAFQTLYKIYIPLLMPTITRCLFLSFLICMRVYDINIALTGGDPYRSSESITLNIYTTAFTGDQMGYGCAKALVFILIVVVISCLQVSLTSKKEVDL